MIRNAIIYLGASVFNKAAPFLLLPLITRYLTPAEFGTLSMFLVINGLFFAIIGMNIHANVTKNFFTSTSSELAILIGNILFILGGTSLLVFILSIGISLTIEQLFSIPGELWLVFPFLSVMMMVNTINLTLLRNEGRAYTYAAFEIFNTLLSVAVTLVLLVGFDFGWYSQIVGILVSNAVFFVVAILYIKRSGYLKFRLRSDVIKSILQLSLPLIPHAVGGVVIAVSDRMFIERMVGLDAVALYTVGYSFGMIIGLFTDAFIKAWSPWFFKSLSKPSISIKLRIVKYTYIYIFSVFTLALFLSTLSINILPFIFDDVYLSAADFIVYISLGYAVQGVYKIIFPYLVHISKTSFLAFSTVFSAILNLIFNYLFILEFGAIGAAYSTLISYFVSALLVFLYLSFNYKMPWFNLKCWA
jgi:O-antigen/teichoic acid export membrane protein